MTARVTMLLVVMLTTGAAAGPVVVRDSSDPPFDAFAMKRELMQQQAWQEALRQQQSLEWLEQLPLWCTRAPGSGADDFSCDGLYYRPFSHDGHNGYLRIDPPEVRPTPRPRP